MDLQPHQQRVVDEKAELDKKIAKLSPFIGTTTFTQLKPMERMLLREQLFFMEQYALCLKTRISHFQEA